MKTAARAARIAPSATLAVDSLAKEMIRSGIDVVSFGLGEPDFDTPAFVKEAAAAALEAGFTKYTPSAGIPELRQAIQRKLRVDNGLEYTPEQIVVTPGAKFALYLAFQAVCDPGDEVIVPAPYWVSYLEQIRMAEGTPVVVETTAETGLKLTAGALRRALTPRTKGLVINSPSNPTGAVYTRAELQALAEVVVERDLFVISDEIYEPFIYGGTEHVSIAGFGPELLARTILIHGVSKSHAMTGWRIGYAAGPKPVIAAMNNVQSHSVSHATSFAQKAAVAALEGPQESVDQMVEEFRRRRDYLVAELNRLPGVTCAVPEGAFYAFPHVAGIFGKEWRGQAITDSSQLAQLLLKEAKVALAPGSAFGAEGYLRLSYATSMANLEKGVARMRDFWSALK